MKTRFQWALAAQVMLLACVSRAEPAASTASRNATKARSQSAAKGWLAESDRHAQLLLNVMAKYAPEEAALLGVEGHDGEIMDRKPQASERYAQALSDAAASLESAAVTASDPRVKVDLAILVGSARDQSESLRLQRRLLLPYSDMAKEIFQSFHALLDPRIAKARQAAALVRLRKYTGREPGYSAITALVRADYEQQAKNTSLVAPWDVEVKQDLENRARYVDGIRDLFSKSGLSGWQQDLELLGRQLEEYNNWISAQVLPRARKNNRLPPEIYADNLKQFGVRMDPHELIERALASFMQTRDELQSVARVVAEKRGYPASDYVSVIRELKKERIPVDKLLAVYNARLAAIEQIARDQALVTLPKRAAVIRLATEAESAATPAPHVSIPRLLGNTGEQAEFVLPTKNPNSGSGQDMDDFNYDAITWALTSHEARPGHELQLSSMLENGVSIARAVFAFTSANVEGWGLYAEAIVKAYVPPEGQLGILQLRMMRAARAFLDPMVNLGMLDPDAAKRLLIEQVRLSEPMAKQEVDRYTFDAPGQATSYFYGYTKLSALRTRVEIALGPRFSALAYHDAIVSAGILPLDVLERTLLENFVPAQLSAPAKVATQ